MEQQVKEHLEKYAISKEWATDEDTLVEIVTEGKEIHSEDMGSHRWWDDVYRVVLIDGMYIGYMGASTTGDDSPREKGWEFDPDSIEQVIPVEKTVTIVEYVPVK